MIGRQIAEKVDYFLRRYPVVTLTGPRQSGKSTLLRNAFKGYEYLSFEDPDVLLRVKEDPRLFLEQYPGNAIFDEAQRFPEIYSWLQTHVDKSGSDGLYILSGSHNFLLMEKISQSLAGRTAILRLLPFSFKELIGHGLSFSSLDEIMFKGFYPRIYDKKLKPSDFYPFYIQTYVERDVRQVVNISDVSKFVKFIKLCAGRIGQLLNLSSLSNECGISQPTANAWLSILESSYIVYLLKPYHKNYNKRLVKTPKLYFYDVGLASSLLGINSKEQVFSHFLRGALFENLIIMELIKAFYNRSLEPSIYFWRDNTGNEIDLLVHQEEKLYAFEIKSGSTYNPDFFKNIVFWEKISGQKQNTAVIYGGQQSIKTKHGNVISWQDWCNEEFNLEVDNP